jgi:sulfide:quinone oxidoreductase
VLAAGAEYDWSVVPGAAEAHSFYDLESARRLRRRLRTFRKGRIVVAVSRLPYKCPPAPFEAVLILNWAFRRRGVRKDIEIHVCTPEPAVLPIAGPQAGARLAADLERRGIVLHTHTGIRAVSGGGKEAHFTDGSSMDADLVVTIPVHRAPELVRKTSLAGPQGWIPVASDTLETRVPGVFAVGDVNSVPMTKEKGLPKAGVFASAEGRTVGHNIAAAVMGTETTVFPGVGHCSLMYTGSRAAMMEGRFLSGGVPQVRFQAASAKGGRAKLRFERDWRAFEI